MILGTTGRMNVRVCEKAHSETRPSAIQYSLWNTEKLKVHVLSYYHVHTPKNGGNNTVGLSAIPIIVQYYTNLQ